MEQKTLVTEKKRGGRRSVKFRGLSVSEKEKIYQQHLGLVILIAKEYVGRSPDFTFEDLIQEGILGLFKAAEKFDEQKSYRFSTYAARWIKQSINRALYNYGRTIRIPVNMIDDLSRYTKVRRKLLEELSREPLVEEMAASMKITTNRVQQIKERLENPLKIISLERPAGEDEYINLSEIIEDERETPPVELASRNILREDLGRTIEEILTPREEKIIKMRFGLEDGISHTLQEIADEIERSSERVRQIINRTLAKMREREECRLRRFKKESQKALEFI